jgi:hypothetical protein
MPTSQKIRQPSFQIFIFPKIQKEYLQNTRVVAPASPVLLFCDVECIVLYFWTSEILAGKIVQLVCISRSTPSLSGVYTYKAAVATKEHHSPA